MISRAEKVGQSFGGVPCGRMGVSFLHCVKRPNKHHSVKTTSNESIVQYNKLFLAVREIQPISRLIITRCIQGKGLSTEYLTLMKRYAL